MSKSIPKSCRHRHHSYPSDDPGAECLGCGKKRGTYTPRALGAGGAAGLRAALGIPGAGAPPEKQQPPPAPELASPAPAAGPPVLASSSSGDPIVVEQRRKPSTVIWPRVAHRLTQAFDSFSDTLVEKMGREPNSAEQEDLNEFEGALAEQLGIWFPDVAAGPKARMGLAAFFIVMEKRWNAEKIAKPAAPTPPAQTTPAPPREQPTNVVELRPGGAPAADTTAEAELLRDLQT